MYSINKHINMTTAIFIPARLESKRLPKKLLQPIGDKPMIVHVIEQALKTNAEKIIIATDSVEIMNVVKNIENVECVMTSKEHQTGSDRIYEALNKIDPERNIKYIINLQGDLPFIDPEVINTLSKKAIDSKADAITLATPLNAKDIGKIGNENVTKVALSFQDKDNTYGKALYFSRQPIPHNAQTYYEHIGIYLFKREALEKFVNINDSNLEKLEKLEQLRLLENDMSIEVFITNRSFINVDTMEGLEKARNMLKEKSQVASAS